LKIGLTTFRFVCDRLQEHLMSYLDRYAAGEREQVWDDLIALGHQVRHATYFADAYAVARETMRRVRGNVEIVAERLSSLGYEFARPESVFVPPGGDAVELIKRIEESLGPLPLSLRAFYEVAGSMDFTQSTDQLIHYDRPERVGANEIQILGEEDPLVVAPLSDLAEVSTSARDRVYFCFADDEFHKANYSGGENYHVWLPDPRADFEIVGMYKIDERFFEYLRATFGWGGCRGRVETIEEDDSRCRKVAPKLEIVRRLAEGLLPL
jgi:hypothetical protein